MIGYILAGAGGALGSLARYSIGRIISEKYKAAFPLGTFLINISGAVLLGIVSTVGVKENSYILLADGFLGAYTTFSTFMYEGVTLFRGNDKLNAAAYILGSLLFGMIGFAAGVELAALLRK